MVVKVPPFVVPQLAPCASPARAWRLWAARHSQGEAQPPGAQPPGAQPPPRGLKRAASKVVYFTAFDRLGGGAGAGHLWRDGATVEAQPATGSV